MSANYQHLRAFHAIAREGSVTRAARRLNVAQPTLSQQLKALEARHGVSLFESRRAPLRLSAAGRDLYELTERLFAAALDVDEMLGEAGAEACGSLRLGSDSPTYAARLIEAFRRRHPHTAVQVRMGNANDVMRWLAAAEVDAAVAADPPGDGMFIYEPLYVDHLSCALPTGHPLAGSASIPIATLAREVLLTREGKSKTRAFTERVFAEAGVEPRTTIELQSRETIREGVALGLGVSVFFSSECPPDPRIVYRPLDTAGRELRLLGYLVGLQAHRRNVIMRTLRDVAREIVANSASAALSQTPP